MVRNKEFKIDGCALGLPVVTICQIKSSSMKDLTQKVDLPRTNKTEEYNYESVLVAPTANRNPSMPTFLPEQQTAAKRTVIVLNKDRSGIQLQDQSNQN